MSHAFDDGMTVRLLELGLDVSQQSRRGKTPGLDHAVTLFRRAVALITEFFLGAFEHGLSRHTVADVARPAPLRQQRAFDMPRHGLRQEENQTQRAERQND